MNALARHEGLFDLHGGAAASAYRDRVPIVQDLDVTDGQQRKAKIDDRAGIVRERNAQQIPAGLIDPGIESPDAVLDQLAAGYVFYDAFAGVQHTGDVGVGGRENLVLDALREHGGKEPGAGVQETHDPGRGNVPPTEFKE